MTEERLKEIENSTANPWSPADYPGEAHNLIEELVKEVRGRQAEWRTVEELLRRIEGSTVDNVGVYEEIRKMVAIANRYISMEKDWVFDERAKPKKR